MKDYTYNSNHLNLLKKYGTIKLMFILMFCLVLLLQSMTWLIVWSKDVDIIKSDMVFVVITLIGSLAMMATQMIQYRINFNIIKNVQSEGSFTTRAFKTNFSNKSSWAWGYVLLTRILCVLFIILLGIVVYNFVQNYVNWGEIILKAPMMLFIAIGFLNLSFK